MRFQDRDVLKSDDGSSNFIVLERFPDKTWTFDLNRPKTAFAEDFRTEFLDARVAEGALKIDRSVRKRTVTKKMREYSERAFGRLKPISHDIQMLYTTDGRARAFRLLGQEDPTLTRKTFLKLVRLYCSCAGVPSLMLPSYDRCGHSKIDTADLESIPLSVAKEMCQRQALKLEETNPRPRVLLKDATKYGKARRRNEPIRPTVFECDRYALRLFMDYFRRRSPTSGNSNADLLLDLWGEVFSSESGGDTLLWNQQCIPSYRQFDYWYNELTPYIKKRLNKKTQQEFATSERASPGDEFSKTPSSASIGSGDATIWNVALRSRFPDAQLIGCPVVFRIRDKRGMLLGISISMESASWNGFAKAIDNCLEDKVQFCAKYGIHISPEEWPVRGLPGTIEADCGETDNTKPEPFIAATGTHVKNIWKGRAEMKPGVESDFRTLEVTMNGDTPGACLKRWFEFQGKEWRIEGEYTIDAFMKKLLRHELDKMKKPTGRNLPSEMVADGCDASPLSVWNWDLRNLGGGLRSFNRDEVQLSLLSRDPVSITPHGVAFKGIYYTAAELIKLNAFDHAARYGNSHHVAAFDEGSVNHIWLLPDSHFATAVLCHLNMTLVSQHDFMGKTFREVKLLRTKQDINDSLQHEVAAASRVNTRMKNRKLTEEQKARTAGSIGHEASTSSQIKGLPAARLREANAHSPEIALKPFVGPASVPVENNVRSIDAPKRRKKKSTSDALLEKMLTESQNPANHEERA